MPSRPHPIAAVAAVLLAAAAPRALAAQAAEDPPLVASSRIAVVDTRQGKVQGFIHRSIHTFRGIPYAKAARFMPPQDPDAWNDTRSALTYGPICPQVEPERYDDVWEFLFPSRRWIQGDNCQNLNIWTPGIRDGRKRPVMVWLHGGGFASGSAIAQFAYDGDALSRRGDVVVVTVNHRLNVMGFLDLSAYGPRYRGSANAGILDLVAALRWIQDNIAQFGGDASNVLIFGQSGGAGKVASLMAAPAARGLFHKAVIQSGGVILRDRLSSRRIAELVLQNLGIDPSRLDKLQSLPFREISEAADKAMAEAAREAGPPRLFGWSPVADGEDLPVLSDDFALLDAARGVPLMIGSTLNEFAPFALRQDPRLAGAGDWSAERVKDHLRKSHGDNTDAIIAAIRRAYPDSTPGDWIAIDTRFRSGVLKIAARRAEQNAAPTYVYLFGWQSPVQDGALKAAHGSEIPFVFFNVAVSEQGTGGGLEAWAMAKSMSSAWIGFARTGVPASSDLDEWPAYTRENPATMFFDRRSKVRTNHDQDLLDLLHPTPGAAPRMAPYAAPSPSASPRTPPPR